MSVDHRRRHRRRRQSTMSSKEKEGFLKTKRSHQEKTENRKNRKFAEIFSGRKCFLGLSRRRQRVM